MKWFQEEVFREGAVWAHDLFLLMIFTVDSTDEIQIVTHPFTVLFYCKTDAVALTGCF